MKKLIVILLVCLLNVPLVHARNHHHNSCSGSDRYNTQVNDVLTTAFALMTLNSLIPRPQPIMVQAPPVYGQPGCNTGCAPRIYGPPVHGRAYIPVMRRGQEYLRYWENGQYYYLPNYGLHRNPMYDCDRQYRRY